jgi:hypothetical protein
MDDAALHFALGAVPRPDTADTPSAGVELFVPMLDWFARRGPRRMPAARRPRRRLRCSRR